MKCPLPLTAAACALATMTAAAASTVPSSERSRAAEARVEAQLRQDLAKDGLQLGSPVFIRIFKEPAVLEMWVQGSEVFHLFKSYNICRFSGDLGPKLKEGDRQAPEGFYSVAPKQMNPNSNYHLSFNLGFPNEFDRHHGRTGSFLMVHGACASIGCYAMGDDPMEEIWTLCTRALENGQPFFWVHCFPFPLTDENLNRTDRNPWASFWRDLKPIFDDFEDKRIPPPVAVINGRYTRQPMVSLPP
jgi:murein L,D-transpeptidase YafK